MKITKIALIATLAVLSIGAGVFFRLQNIVAPQPEHIKESISYDKETGNINVLVVGIDDVEGGHRSDTIGLATIDIDDKIVRFMSLPRDTRVQIPGHGWQKLNHAYAYGGTDLLRQTIINYLGLPINYHVLVNYESFPKIVDMIGGVEINVEKRLYYQDKAGKLFINIPKGLRQMNGKTALEYVRFRNDALGDIGRVQRQQQFIKAVMKKVQSPEMLPKLPDFAKEILNLVNTNMTMTQAVQLTSYLRDINTQNMAFFTLPGKAAYISNVSYWLGDLAAASTLLSGPLPGEESAAEEAATQTAAIQTVEEQNLMELVKKLNMPIAILNGDGQAGLGKTASSYFQKAGIDVAYVGNAKHYDYHYSSIQYPTKKGDEAQQNANILKEICGISNQLVQVNETIAHVTLVLGHDKDTILNRVKNITTKQ
ncbi:MULTISPECIES: LCP family protein [Aminobacterium]|jgi:LCP family protein required for cell wall assembly|uniref:Cell envelope-related transcriptional attenuator n=1 Tax=Aminobacterium colombiense (strain DSM 12261 / ALA-1) TaxID=572547 RepID=D5EEJ1_AMICL|nr:MULTISPECIES: LCP family protein [Aminobacterium]MDD2378849.1 LCP family protein [Aminobacterium colombiense]ADE56973.1 cell envelope-related transcriptional attenuator [Aminobacterium colombiense DSM 12261]MDD3767609.1 LCP family protein [Aminobacterium colombiense]MDD4265402.1 LCP family protein [Aminobacterium colombiense]MDD4585631.1 LCP family protein [Aminobacterium colombiense]